MSRSIDCPVWQRVTIQSILAIQYHSILAQYPQYPLYPCTAKERENAVSDNEPSVLGICPDSLYWHRSLTPLKNICPWRLRLYWHRSLQNKEHLLSLVRRKLTFWRLYLTSATRSLFFYTNILLRLHQHLSIEEMHAQISARFFKGQESGQFDEALTPFLTPISLSANGKWRRPVFFWLYSYYPPLTTVNAVAKAASRID